MISLTTTVDKGAIFGNNDSLNVHEVLGTIVRYEISNIKSTELESD